MNEHDDTDVDDLPADAFPLLAEWNSRCEPPWSEAELRHKLEDADKRPDARGYLLNGHTSRNGHAAAVNGHAPPDVAVEHEHEPDPAELFANSRGDSDGVPEPTTNIGLPKPKLILPGDSVSISEAAEQLGGLLARGGQVFRRGAAVVQLAEDDDGEPILRPVKPAHLASLAETVAMLVKVRHTENGAVQSAAVMQENVAKLILHADAFVNELPPIKILSRCPVLTEVDGVLVQVTGYHRQSGVLAAGQKVADVPVDEAKQLLAGILADFLFAAPGDRSRAIAALITPAMVHGGLLGGRAPVDLGEADRSQGGKGYRCKLTAAVYRCTASTVTQKQGGVGSIEESFSSAVVRGAGIINFDNIRKRLDSPTLESFLTEDRFSARVPYSGDIEVDPRRIIVMMTSNKAEVTRDLANRSSCVRIIKQPSGYQYRQYQEGDVLDHVRRHQPKYLGAVFSVIREWHRHGKPATRETGHDFRKWAQPLDWIVQNIFDAAPLLQGHAAATERMTSPLLGWLRDIALLVVQAERTGAELRAHDIAILIRDTEVELPGAADDVDIDDGAVWNKILMRVGVKLGKCFPSGKLTVEIDGIVIERISTTDAEGRPRHAYKFTKVEVSKTPIPQIPQGSPRVEVPIPQRPREGSDTFLMGGDEQAHWKDMDPRGDPGEPGVSLGKSDSEGDAWTF